jgi:putative salt-induced outer membrane protein
MLNTKILAALACLAAPGLALAAPNGWSGEAGLGYLASNGNSKTSSLNAKFALNYVEDQWKNSFLATAFMTSDQGASTGERYGASDKLDYNFTEHDYAFGNVEYDKDLFGPIGERTVETVGYGRHVLTGPVHTLDLEIGAGARQAITNDTNEREDDAVGRLSGKYVWKISGTSAFSQSLKIESGSTDTFTESVTELKFNVVGNIFASASYTLRNNTQVPPGIGRTDTFTALNLSYTFGVK